MTEEVSLERLSFCHSYFSENLFQQLYNTANSLIVGVFLEVMRWLL